MYIMDYSDNVNDLVDPGQEMYLDEIQQILKDANLSNGSYVQYRDDDGNVFRLVVKSGDIQIISPKWDM